VQPDGTVAVLVNTDRLLAHSILFIISLSQLFKPDAQSLKVGNRLVAGDIIHFGMITLSELPELKVLGELCITH
jgi:hypothetical protein